MTQTQLSEPVAARAPQEPTRWVGWIVFGACLALGQGWARWVAILVSAVGILTQIGFLAAYPIWSTLVIAFDVLVLFALIAHWGEVQGI